MAPITQPLPSGGAPQGSFGKRLRESGVPWLFVAPALAVMFVISFLPQAYQIYISLFDFRTEHLGGKVAPPFIGLENYADVLIQGLNVPNYNFFALLGFNIVWTLINVFFHVTLGIAIAIALNGDWVIGRRFYRTLFVIPWALPGYITALIWNNLWQQHGGGFNLLAEALNERLGFNLPTSTNWLNETAPPIDLRPLVPALLIVGGGAVAVWLALRLRRTGLRDPATGRLDNDRLIFGLGGAVLLAVAAISTAVAVLQSGYADASTPFIELFDRAAAPALAFYCVLIANTWLGWPFMTVVATGALQSIPPDLYEAAEVDGASRWQQFRNITLPMIRPTMVPAIMLGTIWTFNQFNVIFFITAGGPRGQTNLLITQAYILIQQEQLYGAAAAFSIVVFFVLLGITLINNRITRATEAYDEG